MDNKMIMTYECPQCLRKTKSLIFDSHIPHQIGFLCFDCRDLAVQRLQEILFRKKKMISYFNLYRPRILKDETQR